MAKTKIQIDKKEIEQWYWQDGKQPSEIAQILGTTKNVIRSRMLSYGIPFRSKRDGVIASYKSGKRKPHPPSKAVLKTELDCHQCGAFWQRKTDRICEPCPFCGNIKSTRDNSEMYKSNIHAPERLIRLKEWYSNRDNRLARATINRALNRKQIFFRISGSINPRCARCGCDDDRLLEVNHKYGGGNKELQKGKHGSVFYRAIITGKRSTNDLEILCKPCNAIHYLETKYGILPMRVIWTG